MYLSKYSAHIKDERDRIIEEFIPVVKALALKVAKGLSDDNLIDDLISAGVLGLLEAIERYEPKRGIKLKTYAYLRIRGAMIDELRMRDYFPRSARAKAKKIEKAIDELERKLGRTPDEEEIAEYLNIDKEDYLDMLKDFSGLSVVSLDEISELSGEDREKIVRYLLEEGENPEKEIEAKEIERIISEEFEKLPERQKLVLSLYYVDELNMKEIAQVLGVTEARVCQIHSQAILNLRSYVKRRIKG